MFNTFNNILKENGICLEAVPFEIIHNEFAGKTTAEFIAEEKRLRDIAEAVDAENAARLENTLHQIETLNASEKVKAILRSHAKIVFETNYAKIYLSDEEMDLIAS
jgi:hypothetical protein